MKTESQAGTEPKIDLTSVPAYGSFLNLKGVVRHADSNSVRLAVFIRVHGGWWTKPYWDAPATSIAADGSFSLDITTGGSDEQASDIAVFLVPADYQPPALRGETEIPSELRERAVTKVEVTRAP